ncbi:MAG: HAMP domain-containing sensor histidine kinase [Lachnospiraceae bacterium]|nr:HAMP domain-containing sensor histidine kinase [Lachnospiraceae bacterium]
MKHSIKKHLALVFIALTAGLIFVCWLANNIFLEQYYMENKKRAMMDAYLQVNEAANEDTIGTETFEINLQNTLARGNISILVLDQSYHTVISSVNESNILGKRLLENIYNSSQRERTVLEETDRYTLCTLRDQFLNKDYLELWGSLDNGDLFILRSPVESIRESVEVSNRFLAYIGIAICLVGVIIIWFVSKRITEPILKLADISKRMSGLDFGVRYEGKEKNELGVLGANINEMADKLETAISELKTANNELQRDIEKKTQVDEMRKEFLSNVSHELKTPIALIQGYAEGLQECINDDAESRNFYCDVIIDEAGKMNRMVKKLLTLNRLEFGNQKVVMERFDIVSLINGVVQSSEIMLQQKGVTLRMEKLEPVFVWADEFDIEEVFTNYFSNALNHVDFEKIVEVKVVKNEKKVRVSVFNTGQQIPEEDIDKIWIKFYKVDKARTREYGGSGIGLSIVKAIMESLHQQYGVKNWDNGVEFWFELDGE